MCVATPCRMWSVSSRSGCVTATAPKSWSCKPTRPPGHVTRAISRTTRSGSATCRITVMARAASKRPAANGSWAPSTSRHGSGTTFTRVGSTTRVEASALFAAEVADLVGFPAADRPRLHDVGLAHRILDELVRKRAARSGRGRENTAQQREEQDDGHRHPEDDGQQPHGGIQRSGLMETARRNSLSWAVSSDETVTPFLLPAKKMPVS